MSSSALARRSDLPTAGRVVVKVGSSSLTTPDGMVDDVRLKGLVDALAGHRQRGTEVVLVSSGAIAAGLEPLGLSRRPRDLATQQAAASVGQGRLLARYTAAFGGHGGTPARCCPPPTGTRCTTAHRPRPVHSASTSCGVRTTWTA